MAGLMRILRAPLDFALPRRCAGCGQISVDDGHFCAACWQALVHLPDRGCSLCNTPVAIADTVCGPCLAAPPRHDGVLAAVEYGETARKLALKLKYGRKPAVAGVMASLMVRHARREPDAVLMPVPLHRWRIWHRGFNQSLLIAREVSALTGQPILSDALVRTKRTSPLGGLSRSARSREVQGAFRAAPDQAASIKGTSVLLVDDVYTTGATANACARVLKRAGATSVHVLCWARVVREMT